MKNTHMEYVEMATETSPNVPDSLMSAGFPCLARYSGVERGKTVTAFWTSGYQ